jgi:D-alanyl-D-alanine carboxypeptidase/D-alanyl-D-alanine-endopeptidase (penicillin-binding protein 4)
VWYTDKSLSEREGASYQPAAEKQDLMTSIYRLRTICLFLGATAVFCFSAQGQSAANSGPQPFLQDITVQRDGDSTDLVKKTSSIAPIPAAVHANSSIPVLAEVEIPGYTGILVQKMDGTTVVEIGSDLTFNPASNVKIATAYAVLKTFGPEYRFPTNVWTDGTVDQATGTLTGNIYISGRDPMFGYEHAVSIANELNHLGIRSVTGDLIVTSDFVMNYSSATSRTSQILLTTLDGTKRSAAATRAWLEFLNNSGRAGKGYGIPGVSFSGSVYVQPIPSSLKLLFTHESAPMREILKATLCYSNNFLAERLGDMLGGPFAVARIVQQTTGVQPAEFSIQTSSGLGINRVSPAAMMKLLRAFSDDLARYRMTYADIMPVAGVDKGTLEERFDSDFSKGSVVGKTGTLGQTDGGVSALAGQINTRNGKLLFVIFNQRGSVSRFRAFQNFYVSLVQGQFGGAAPLDYTPVEMGARLAKTKIEYPSLEASINP